MPNLFSKIEIESEIDTSPSYENKISNNSYYNEISKLDEEYYTRALEFLRYVYTGNKESILSIIQEAFFDFNIDTKNNFFKVINRSIDYYKEKKYVIIKTLLKKKYRVQDYLNKDFTEFTIKGYNYTIDPSFNINNDIIYDIIKKHDMYIDDVIYERKTPSVATSIAYNEINSNEIYNSYRGKVIGISYCTVDEYRVLLRAKFRDNTTNKIDILVNKITLMDIIKKLNSFDYIINISEKEENKIDEFNDMISRFADDNSKLITKYHKDFYNKDKVNAVASIHSQAVTAMRMVYNIYNTYIVEKINAIHEAIDFYIRILERVDNIS